MTQTPSKTTGRVALGIQIIPGSSYTPGSIINVASIYEGEIIVTLGRAQAAAGASFTAPVIAELWGSYDTSGNSRAATWFKMESIPFALGATLVSPHVITTALTAGQQTGILLSSYTSLGQDNIVFFEDAAVANSEWADISQIPSGTSLSLNMPMLNAHAITTTYVNNAAERIFADIDLKKVQYVQARWNSNQNSVTHYAEMTLNTWDSQ